MSVLAHSRPVTGHPVRAVPLDGVRHGLVDPDRGTRDLDAALDTARAAEHAGVSHVVVPNETPGRRTWPGTAQALAVLLATSRVRVVLPVDTATCEPETLARFATSAAGLSDDRLTIQVVGADAARVAGLLGDAWDGEVLVGGDAVVVERPSPARAG